MTTQQIQRRAWVLLPLAAVVLATLMGNLAVLARSDVRRHLIVLPVPNAVQITAAAVIVGGILFGALVTAMMRRDR